MSFLEACFSEAGKRLLLLEAGFYYEQIERYLRFFDRSRFLFLVHDDLEADPLGALRRAFEFVGVDPAFVPTQYRLRINAMMSQERVGFYLRRMGGLLKRKVPRLFSLAKHLPVARLVQKRIDRDGTTGLTKPGYPPMSAEDRSRLSRVYYDHDERLSEFLKRDLVSLWHSRD
jgi:hypothetical protein